LKAVLELVGLEGFEKRDVAQLSGGERQRVALARSLAPNPRLLMLDEPLGSLDAALRDRLVVELRDIIKRIGLTAIYVTHDQHEAFAIADQIAVMNAGQIEQIDTPPVLYRHPTTTFAARFLGLDNIVPVLSRDADVIHTPVGSFPHRDDADAILLHPDGLQIASSETGTRLEVVICELVFSGDSYRVQAQHDRGIRLSFQILSREIGDLKIGDVIQVSIAEDYVVPLRGES
jgi:ABC-type Fe3+/spermidine/putrescine transport system ATPase subunit